MRDLTWAYNTIRAEPPPLTERVEADLADLSKAVSRIEVGIRRFERAVKLMEHSSLSGKIEEACDTLRDLIAQAHDEVLGKIDFGGEVQRAHEMQRRRRDA